MLSEVFPWFVVLAVELLCVGCVLLSLVGVHSLLWAVHTADAECFWPFPHLGSFRGHLV